MKPVFNLQNVDFPFLWIVQTDQNYSQLNLPNFVQDKMVILHMKIQRWIYFYGPGRSYLSEQLWVVPNGLCGP